MLDWGVLAAMAAMAVLIWVFRPITVKKVIAVVAVIAVVWYIREVLDFGRNPIDDIPAVPDVVPDVEINP